MTKTVISTIGQAIIGGCKSLQHAHNIARKVSHSSAIGSASGLEEGLKAQVFNFVDGSRLVFEYYEDRYGQPVFQSGAVEMMNLTDDARVGRVQANAETTFRHLQFATKLLGALVLVNQTEQMKAMIAHVAMVEGAQP